MYILKINKLYSKNPFLGVLSLVEYAPEVMKVISDFGNGNESGADSQMVDILRKISPQR